MPGLFSVVVSNVLMAAVLAVGVLIITRIWRNPQLAHVLWMLVLVKLVTPPLIPVDIPAQRIPFLSAESTSNRDGQTDVATRTQFEIPEVDAGGSDTDPSNDSDTDVEATLAELLGDAPHSAGTSGDAGVSLTAADSFSESRGALAFWKKHATLFLLVVWVTGSVLFLLLLFQRCFRFTRVLKSAHECDREVTSTATRLAGELDLRRCPSVRVVDAAVPPLVWCPVGKPRIILPADLLTSFDREQQETVLAHELAHVKRGDHLVRWLEVVVLTVFWWNPVAWFARRKLREAEEECCDAWVVWLLPENRRSYGQAMLKTIEFLTEDKLLPVPAGSPLGSAFYKRRIEMIMQQKLNRKLSRWTLAIVVLIGIAVLPVTAQTNVPEAPQSSPTKPGTESGLEQPTPKPTAEDETSPAEAKPAAPRTPIERAIQDGQRFLISEQQPDGSWKHSTGRSYKVGTTSLAVMALLESGMTTKDQPVANGLKFLRTIPLEQVEWVYEVALMLMALGEANEPKQDLARMTALAKSLVDSQVREGQMAGTWSYLVKPGPNRGDHSNAQFGLLGLRAASLAGVQVDPEVWKRAETHWQQTQNDQGGWSYMHKFLKPTGSMTAAGVTSLSICRQMLLQDVILETINTAKSDEPIRKGLVWLGKNFSANSNPESKSALLYYMLGVSRSCHLNGQTKLGTHNWYREMSAYLLKNRLRKDGSIKSNDMEKDPVLSTAFAVIFLANGPVK